MRLKKLYIHGFKSFADRVEMAFEHGVTGVVGPNGCGKSNIADAVRWVLGEQSARQLRGAKMEDVIFGGTETRRRMAYCEVTLTFENDDHALPSDYFEVAVTRRVYRTGDSEYLLNGAPCRLKDIVDQFRDTGIGRDGYSIIGQGRIDDILSQKSEDRRLVFEEAAGIVKYKTRKLESERRLENTRVNLSRVTDILSELEARIEPLRLQSEDARRYLQLRDEQKALDLNVFLVRTERLNARIFDARETVLALKEALDAGEREQAQLNDRREKSQYKLGECEAEAASLRDALQALIQSVEAQEGRVGVLNERIQAARRERERAQADLDTAREGGGGIEKRIADMADKLALESENLNDKQRAQELADERLSACEAEAAECERMLEQAKDRMIAAMNSLGDMKGEQAHLSALLESVEGQIQAMAAGEAEDGRKVASLKRAVSEADEIWQTEDHRLRALNQAAFEVSEHTRRAGEEYERLNAEAQKLQSVKQDLATRLKLLGEMQRDYEGYNHSVKQVLKEAERMGGAGVRGVVANILRAPQKLERALDMVLGAALQYVVVESEEDAQYMIEYLKRNRFGRATFLPINSVRGRTLDNFERLVLDMPGCVGLASELIECDAEYKDIVVSLLGRTVIAENLTSGIAIQRAGRRQFRLVTLDGDVMHSGGSMTGGSLQSRVTSLLSRERMIQEGAEQTRALEAKYQKAREVMREREEARASLKKERAQLFEEVHQQEIAVTRAEEHLKVARDELNGHLQRAERVREARAHLLEQKDEIEENLRRMGERKLTYEGEGEQTRAEAAELQARLVEIRARLADMRVLASDARVAYASAKRGYEAMEQDLNRMNAQKGDAARMLKQALQALDECDARLTADTEALTGEEGKLAIVKISLDEARRAFQAADERRLSVQNELKRVSESAEALRVKTEDFLDRHHRGELALSRAETELAQLTERIWEDYQLTYEGASEYRAEDFKLQESEKRLAVVKAEIRQMGNVNVAAVDEYRQTTERFRELSGQRDDLARAQEDLERIIDELTGKMEKLFRAQFEQLDVYFRQTFAELFGGGRAELRLEDPRDALGSGIEIVAQPPGKKLQMLSLLSGGERALTAIAILFAMLKLKPTPFCILDEIEAALDDANIDNFAEYLKTYSVKTQFVVVTHRKGTMARCDALYGVAMEEKGVSKMVSLRLAEAIA